MAKCPPKPAETAEAYCMNRLPAEEAQQFEEHYLTCPQCAAEVTEAQEFIEAFRRASKPPQKRTP